MGHVGDSPDLQPLVEVKNLVRQQSSQLESFTAHLQVRGREGGREG